MLIFAEGGKLENRSVLITDAVHSKTNIDIQIEEQEQ
jgi:hypothetical protein